MQTGFGHGGLIVSTIGICKGKTEKVNGESVIFLLDTKLGD